MNRLEKVQVLRNTAIVEACTSGEKDKIYYFKYAQGLKIYYLCKYRKEKKPHMSSNKVRLLLPEYGRNVQKMVKFLKTIEDRTLRNRQAEVVVGLMGNLYPGRHDTEDFQHMLWDHLFMIAEFDLDIDSPFPKPDPSHFFPQPQKIPYTQSQDGARNWGRYLPKMIKAISETKDVCNEDIEMVAKNIANYAKQKSKEFNIEATLSSSIAEDIERFSGGTMHVNVDEISEVKSDKNGKKNNFRTNTKTTQTKRFKQPQAKGGFKKNFS